MRAIGKPADKTEANGLFFSVSLGQGQEPVAEKALDRMHASGGWVMLQNIELVANWLPKLEKKLEALIEGAHVGRGLGRIFLKHLRRARVICYVIDVSSAGADAAPPLSNEGARSKSSARDGRG